MKPFNLEEAKAGKPVATRDGRIVRIVCWDRKDEFYPILALVGEREEPLYFTTEGRFYNLEKSRLDLVMAPEKREGWMNIYKGSMVGKGREGGCFYSTKKEAIENKGILRPYYVTTIKIEWEE